MRALETFAIYVTPFLVLEAITRYLMKRRAVDLTDLQAAGEPNRRPRRVFLLGSWRSEK
jgi:hypothetical protein